MVSLSHQSTFFISPYIFFCSWYRKQWSVFWKVGGTDLRRVDVLYQTDLARMAGMPCDPSYRRLAELTWAESTSSTRQTWPAWPGWTCSLCWTSWFLRANLEGWRNWPAQNRRPLPDRPGPRGRDAPARCAAPADSCAQTSAPTHTQPLNVCTRDQCCGSGMFIPDTGSDFFPSRIPEPNFFHPGSTSKN